MTTTATTEAFPSSRVMALAGVSNRELHYWLSAGIVRPSVTAPAGPGSACRWSYSDVIRVCSIALLRAAGVELQAASVAIALLADDIIDEANNFAIVVANGQAHVFPIDEPGLFMKWLRRAETAVTILPLARVVNQVQERLGAPRHLVVAPDPAPTRKTSAPAEPITFDDPDLAALAAFANESFTSTT